VRKICHLKGRRGKYTRCWWGNVTGRGRLVRLKMDRKLKSKWILQEQNWMTWTIHMALDRDKWWIFIKKVTNLPVS